MWLGEENEFQVCRLRGGRSNHYAIGQRVVSKKCKPSEAINWEESDILIKIMGTINSISTYHNFLMVNLRNFRLNGTSPESTKGKKCSIKQAGTVDSA